MHIYINRKGKVEWMILDATAGNRTMWQNKNSDNIVYVDVERMIKLKPTIYCDQGNTPFQNNVFDTIFFDPPHSIGDDDSDLLGKPDFVIRDMKKRERRLHTYYGLKYAPNKQAMIKLIYNAQREFKRILKDDGLLWLKWCEVSWRLNRVLSVMNDWRALMTITCTDKTHTLGEQQTYWVCMEKILGAGSQSHLKVAYEPTPSALASQEQPAYLSQGRKGPQPLDQWLHH